LTTRYLNIDAKHRRHFGVIAHVDDFTVNPGNAVNPEIILEQPNFSLYCFDEAARTAIFTELPRDVDLSAAPFIYRAQYATAQRLLEMSYDTFRRIAHQLPKIDDLIMIYSTGRSGSTLLSSVFNAVEGVVSLSEPDAATQLLNFHVGKALSDTDLHDLVDCTVRVLFRRAGVCVLKPRSDALKMMDLFAAVFPNVRNLFSYREAVGFVTSWYRVLQGTDYPQRMSIEEFGEFFRGNTLQDLTYTADYLDPGTTDLTIPRQMTLWWIAIMEWYLAQYKRGIPALAVSYSNLNNRREPMLEAIFRYCNLPTDQVQAALGTYDRDSQAGTELGRANPDEGNRLRLSDAELAEIARILSRHPVIKEADFVPPGTPTL
jgi:hypothetical protein